MMHCCTKRMNKFSIANVTTDDKSLGKIQRSTFGIGVDLWKRGRSNAVSAKTKMKTT